ncbi:hypothetical protein [Actinoplanes sp. GCM10030250]|uniref:hypothetical protein n=1 Tax=Actinoplanes sp. GCM10030250 TaxID=3273376 RepID=UPI0036094AFA
MPRYQLRPSKPQAVFTAAGAAALLIFGIVQMVRSGEFQWFFVLWVVIGLLVIGGALVQGFGRRPTGMGTATVDDASAPANLRFATGKPMAVIGAVAGAAILIFGVVKMAGTPNSGFLVLWVIFGVAIIAFNLWTAFGRRGASHTATRED